MGLCLCPVVVRKPLATPLLMLTSLARSTTAQFPELFKALLMTAFPPIDALDSRSGTNTGSRNDFENMQINFMRVLDHHLHAVSEFRGDQRFVKAALGAAPGYAGAV